MPASTLPGPSNGGSQYARGDEGRAALVGEMWGQSKVVWGHCWYGDTQAKADPRGGFHNEQDFLQVKSNRDNISPKLLLKIQSHFK